jgi:hypothetical protein
MSYTDLDLQSNLIRRARRRNTGNLEINQCLSGYREALDSKRTAHRTLVGKMEGKR